MGGWCRNGRNEGVDLGGALVERARYTLGLVRGTAAKPRGDFSEDLFGAATDGSDAQLEVLWYIYIIYILYYIILILYYI